MEEEKTESTLLRRGAPVDRPRRDVLLRVIGGPDAGLWVPAPQDKLLIGTAPVCQLKLSDRLASRIHVEAQWEGDGLRIRDLESSNGTHYLGSKVSEATLPLGAVFTVGDSRICVLPALEAVELPPHEGERFGRLVGRSSTMRRLFTAIDRVAATEVTATLIGETGTGKDAIAREIHERSNRAAGPFVVVDCGAVAANLIESELFGHERGSFTGAQGRHVGAFERANGGTIFLDEVGELPLPLQPKLLRALEDRTIQRIGGDERVPVDIRIIAATHRDLETLVHAGAFRADLFYRLAVAVLRVPPLRERPEDIPLLVRSLVERAPEGQQLSPTDETITLLARHDWPGNVRELRNFVERALAFGDERLLRAGGIIAGDDDGLVRVGKRLNALAFKEAKKQVVEQFEKQYIADLLERCEHNYTRAAKEAEMDRNYLADLASRHGLKK